MKKLFSVLFAALCALMLPSAALADAALPNRLYIDADETKWIVAFAVAVVIVAAVIIVGAVRYRRQEAAAEARRKTAQKPEDK